MSSHKCKDAEKSQKWTRGHVCPVCKKGKLESCGYGPHRGCAMCKTCGASNF